MTPSAPSLSFIGIIENENNALWVYVSESVSDLIGFEKHELIGRSALDLAHPEELERVEELYRNISRDNKAACLAYIRLRHKDPHRGYIPCAVTHTNVGNRIVGGISAATSGAKAMHNASTAQEVHVITESVSHFAFRRWDDPTPSSSSPVSPIEIATPPLSASSTSPTESPLSVRYRSTSETSIPSSLRSHQRMSSIGSSSSTSAPGSIRTAMILERFSLECPILYLVNEDIFPSALVKGRSFFDFVARSDEDKVRTAMETIKGWGVNERGSPSDGGFGFNRFKIFLKGRNSSVHQTDVPPSRHRHTPAGTVTMQSHAHPYRDSRASLASPISPTTSRSRMHAPSRAMADRGVNAASARDRERERDRDIEEMTVDAILSPQSDGIIVILRPAPI